MRCHRSNGRNVKWLFVRVVKDIEGIGIGNANWSRWEVKGVTDCSSFDRAGAFAEFGVGCISKGSRKDFRESKAEVEAKGLNSPLSGCVCMVCATIRRTA